MVVVHHHKTAINRKKPSAPSKWIYENLGFMTNGETLDYGSGFGVDATYYGIDGWDPISDPWNVHQNAQSCYSVILCTYVLNVIPTIEERLAVIESIKKLLTWDGVAYITVRNDKKNLNGWTKKGTFQTFVDLNYPVVRRTSGYITYQVMKEDEATTRRHTPQDYNGDSYWSTDY
jgi:hypothetical protein